MSVGHNKPYKLYRGIKPFSKYQFIGKDGVYLYNKIGDCPWTKYNITMYYEKDIKRGFIEFVKHLSEKELFLELL